MAKKVKSTVTFERADSKQQKLPKRREMKRWIKAASMGPVEFFIRFVDEEEGLELNKFRRPVYEPDHKQDYATNVLTFDYEHEPVAKADIVLCTPVVMREAREQNKSFKAHLAHLMIHGALHAQGYDHQSDREAECMEAIETFLMIKLGFDNPYSDQACAHK